MNFTLDGLRSRLEAPARLLRRHVPRDGNGHAPPLSDDPLRAELLSVTQLEEHARSIAQSHEVETGQRWRGPERLLPRLSENKHVLEEAYHLFAEAVKRERRISPAAEWFLDNYYLIEEEIRTARRHLPRGYSRELPRLVSGPSAGFPRVYEIALELISHADGRVDNESLRAFVTGYQSVRPLRLGELWAIPIMLRLALLENLRRVAVRVMAGRRDRDRADFWVGHMLKMAAENPGNVVLVLAEMVKENPPLTNPFVAELASRLHGQGAALVFATTWLEHRLAEQGRAVDQAFQQESQTQATDQVSVGNSIGSLRFLGAKDWKDFVESMSMVEATLREDPAGIYAKMDFATRDEYRHVIEEIARRARARETDVARKAIVLSQKYLTAETALERRGAHVGFHLVDEGRTALEVAVGMRATPRTLFRRAGPKTALGIYLSMIALVTAVVTAGVLWWMGRRGIGAVGLIISGPLLVVCASQVAVAFAHWVTMLFLRPRVLPKMDFCKGIPAGNQTIAAVPTMLTNLEEIKDLLGAMEVRFLANRDENLSFALVTDFVDAATETLETDQKLLDAAIAGVESLNKKYSPVMQTTSGPATDSAWRSPEGCAARFFLFHRKRQWNAKEGVWMGWERKRGKLEQFNEALRGKREYFDTIVGPVECLEAIKFVITLDTDTQLPRDSARQLAGTMAHPLNRPYYDEKAGRITVGYGVLQPRVGISMPSFGRSRFVRLFAGEHGIDPYTHAVSDVYQDAFEEGSFIGKGIYDVDGVRQCLGRKFPENRILSHDLLEGAYARAGLVSDAVLFEEFPSSYPGDMSRRYRWIRGDWQIAGWLGRRVPGRAGKKARNPVSGLSRWKIFDNLRRSVLPPALLAFLLLGWFVRGGAAIFTLIAMGMLLFPAMLTAATQLSRKPADVPLGQHLGRVARIFVRATLREIFTLICLPYDAYISVDAIVRTLFRLTVSKQKLLEWRTAAEAERTGRSDLIGYFQLMWFAPALALGVAVLLPVVNLHGVLICGPILGLWLEAPALAWWLSRPLEARRSQLDESDRKFLGMVARRTWRFFEAFVGEFDNYLPPDNFQQDPPKGAAHRTSPTNIGLSLLANLSAADFGYIPVGAMIDRTAKALATVEKLKRYRGHLFNWYDTRTLEPLRPSYVSTVDSGNLAGHLLTLGAGLAELPGQKILEARTFAGLGQTLDVLLELAKHAGADVQAKPLAALEEQIRRMEQAPLSLSAARYLLMKIVLVAAEFAANVKSHSGEELQWWGHALENQARQFIEELDDIAPWTALPIENGSARGVDEPLTLGQIARMELDVLPTLNAPAALRDAIIKGAGAAARRMTELQRLAELCNELADIDYSFLYDESRHLLSIGFNVDEHRLDGSFYDLLASEARVASFVAIAQGKLPQEHWFSLGRLLTSSGGGPTLLSWSGSMFEYLMPLLIMPTYDRTLLDQTNHGAIERQIAYGRQRGVPWGISESGYNKTDAQLNYQYRAFGVPGLGFKRGLADDLVIAPYATVMALMVDAAAACANLRRLAREGHLSGYGFYEAIDYTPSRLPRGRSSVTVASFMAHHQGMALLSLAYLLLERPMQRRFVSIPSFRATDLLLQERIPEAAPVYPHPAEVSAARGVLVETGANFRIFTTPHTPVPEVHLLSNGRYHLALTNAGGGYSRWRDLAVTRWHEDATRDCWGTFCYLRDVESGEFWSSAHQPTLKRATSYEAIFSQAQAEFRRRDGELDTHVEISVSPEDDIEMRRISITNRGREARTIEVTSYAEVVIALAVDDAAHPAFSNLFVQTEIVAQRQAVLCTRRPRSSDEKPPWMMHLMTVHGAKLKEATYETSRAEFIGRGRSIVDPQAMYRDSLGNSEGSVLDPIVAVRNTVSIGPNETVRLHVVTGMAETRDGAMALVEKYHDAHLTNRVFELAWTHSQVVLRQLDITEPDAQVYGRLATSVLYMNPMLRAAPSVIARNRRGQSALWGYGISGDLPIVLLRIGDQTHLDLVHQVLQAHAYWRVKGLAVDLVIWNEDKSGYRQNLHDQITGMIASGSEASLVDKPGGIFVRRIEQISEEDIVLIQTMARAILSDTAGTLVEQVERRRRAETPVARFNPIRGRRAEVPVATELRRHDLVAFNGMGGFTQDGREYVIKTTSEKPTPAPWVNVLANPWFGTIVSESGGAYSWCENANAYRLTPWHNDPITDASGEAFYIRDEETGNFWSPTPLPAPGPMPYTSRHGFGYSIFEYEEGGISSELITYVAMDAPVKFISIRLRNHSGSARRFSITGYFALVLGDRRTRNQPHIVTEVDPKSGAIFAHNAYNGDFTDRVALLDASEALRTVTGDRTEFLGRNGTPAQPACMGRSQLSGRVGARLDPCAAMQVTVEIADGKEKDVVFVFGSGMNLADARNLVSRFRGTGPARFALEGVWAFWNRTLGTVHVETPDASLNFLVNGWLLYQVLACRIWGRSGYYQSGGAFGFRDQLQDAMSLIHAQPALLREHLLRCAGRQFRAGDVQHWWHPPMGRGVRTHISDDYLWLPYAACRYVKALGDTGVLDEKVSFLESPPLKPEEESRYDLPGISDQTASLYDHCVLAIRHGLTYGEHGLPLMGTGDWNDGMNLVQAQGKGESVWLAFFLHDVLMQFSEIARRRQDVAFADQCVSEAAKLKVNIEQHAWDGQWYRRAYFDDGRPLGSSTDPECQIDSLPQSWAILTGVGDHDRARQGLAAIDGRLVKRDLRVIQLFDPPFDKSDLNPGYVKGYVPGVRENGGQYTHAAVWTVMAFAAAGDVEKAWELFQLINPVRHGDSEKAIAVYKVEPYVIAADVYTNPQNAGRGGWTWYTGSAGWMYRLITESLLGIRLEVDKMRFEPCVPGAWKEYKIHYRYHETSYHITVRNEGGGRVVKQLTADGVVQEGGYVSFQDDRQEHNVEVELA